MADDGERKQVGTAWVEAGQFGWIPTEDERERPPVLLVGQHVTVMVNGEVRSGRCELHPDDQVEVTAEFIAPVSEISVETTDGGLKAHIQATLRPGQCYRLTDAAPGRVLSLQGELGEEIQPEPVTKERVLAALKEAGVVFGIDEAGVQAAVDAPHESHLVAIGQPIVEPQDARIERLFKEVEAADHDQSALKLDLLDRYRIAWVEPGTTLMRRIAPVPGEAGRSVFGKALIPRSPRDVKLQPGPGTVLSDDGNELRSEIAGRPVMVGKAVKVVPSFVHQGDADVTIGHIKFEGDVHISGQVCDSIQVAAGGGLEVRGLVSNAVLEANLDTHLHNLVIGSEVRVGGRVSETAALLPFVNEVSEQLVQLVRAMEQLEGAGVVQASRKKGLPYGLLIKQLLESRFGDLVKLLPHIPSRLAPLGDIAGIGVSVAYDLVEMLDGLSPLELESSAPVVDVLRRWSALEEELKGYGTDAHNLVVKGLENSKIWVSGSVEITGFGSYSTVIQAGESILCPQGVLRGGQALIGSGSIEFKEIGSKAGVATVVSTGKAGRITANLVHPGVILSIGGLRQVVREEGRNLTARIDSDGELNVQIEPIH